MFAETEDDSDVASTHADCPAGKYLLGTGGEVFTSFAEVMLDDLRPNHALTSVTVTGVEDPTGWFLNWSVGAYAICANP